MPRPRLVPLLALAVALSAASSAGAQVYRADTPKLGALYANGQNGRYLMAGQWLFRLDPHGQGLSQAWQRHASTVGWSLTTVPNAWNATDQSEASMHGGVGWYRKDFRLPSSAARYSWVIRFESVNYRSWVWLNGKRLGTNTGAYLPFEFVVDGERRTVQLRGSATVSHADAYVACCEAGLGFVQLPRYHVQQPLDGGTLREVLRAHRPPPMPVSVMYPHHRHLSPRVRVFVDWVADQMWRAR